MHIRKLFIMLLGVLLAMQAGAQTVYKDVFLEEFPTGLWTGFYRYVSCEDDQIYGEGVAHLTINRVLLDEQITRVSIDGTLTLIRFPETDTAPKYNMGMKLNTSSVIKVSQPGAYDVYLNPLEGPSFTAANGYQPQANTLVAAMTSCEGNPYKISIVLHPPGK